MNKPFVYFKTTRLEEDRVVQEALHIINTAILNGSLVYMCEKDNKNMAIKLRHPIEIITADFMEVIESE